MNPIYLVWSSICFLYVEFNAQTLISLNSVFNVRVLCISGISKCFTTRHSLAVFLRIT